MKDCHEESCGYQEPHEHGFACNKSCSVCGGNYWSDRIEEWQLKTIRRFAYSRGLRPKPGTFLYSPLLALVYSMKDAGGVHQFIEEVKKGNIDGISDQA